MINSNLNVELLSITVSTDFESFCKEIEGKELKEEVKPRLVFVS